MFFHILLFNGVGVDPPVFGAAPNDVVIPSGVASDSTASFWRRGEMIMEEIIRVDTELNIFVHGQLVEDNGVVASTLREFCAKGYFLPTKKLIESPGLEPTQKLMEPSEF